MHESSLYTTALFTMKSPAETDIPSLHQGGLTEERNELQEGIDGFDSVCPVFFFSPSPTSSHLRRRSPLLLRETAQTPGSVRYSSQRTKTFSMPTSYCKNRMGC